jgi:hypothetical protein
MWDVNCDDRRLTSVAVVEDQRLGDQRLARSAGACVPRRPRAQGQAERRRDIDAADTGAERAHTPTASGFAPTA